MGIFSPKSMFYNKFSVRIANYEHFRPQTVVCAKYFFRSCNIWRLHCWLRQVHLSKPKLCRRRSSRHLGARCNLTSYFQLICSLTATQDSDRGRRTNTLSNIFLQSFKNRRLDKMLTPLSTSGTTHSATYICFLSAEICLCLVTDPLSIPGWKANEHSPLWIPPHPHMRQKARDHFQP